MYTNGDDALEFVALAVACHPDQSEMCQTDAQHNQFIYTLVAVVHLHAKNGRIREHRILSRGWRVSLYAEKLSFMFPFSSCFSARSSSNSTRYSPGTVANIICLVTEWMVFIHTL